MMPLKWQEGRQPRRLLCFSAAFFLMALIFSLLFVRVEDLLQVMLFTTAAACLIGVLVLLFVREHFRLFLSLFLGLLAGCLWCFGYTIFAWQPAQRYDNQEGLVRLELTEYAESHTSYGTAYGVVTELNGQSCRIKVKVYLQDGSPAFAPGDVLRFHGKLFAAERSFRSNLLQEGYFLTLSQQGQTEAMFGEAKTPLRSMKILSAQISEQIQTLLPEQEGALLAALLSGNQQGFSDAFEQALTVSGTRHITAVSGLHVSILAGILMQFFGKRAGLLLSIPAAITYAALVGFTPSVVRAVILLVFWAAAFWLKQEKDALTAMAAALMVLIAGNPFSAVSAGLLLSFSATLGLVLLSAPLNGIWNRLLKPAKNKQVQKFLRYITGTYTATMAATLFTMPLNLLFFDTVPLLSLLSNVLILWAISLVMVLGIIILVISLFSANMAGVLARWVLYWPLAWVVKCIETVGSMRFAATDSANLLLAGGCIVLLAATLLWREKLLSEKRLLSVTVTVVCVCMLFTAAERAFCGVIEVESAGGQPVILLRGEGLSVINCGSRADTAAELVNIAKGRWNIDQLDTILCSGGNYKSQGGLAMLLETISAKRVLVPAADGAVSIDTSAVNVSCFTRTGMTVASGIPVEVFKANNAAFAIRIIAPKFSLLSLCGLKETEALTVVQEYACEADVLLVDDRLANDWKTLYDLCKNLQPQQILVTSGGYSEHGESFGGIPITLIERDGVQFRFVR